MSGVVVSSEPVVIQGVALHLVVFVQCCVSFSIGCGCAAHFFYGIARCNRRAILFRLDIYHSFCYDINRYKCYALNATTKTPLCQHTT